MENILNNEDIYKKIKKDPTAILQRKNNQIVQKWTEELLIPLKTAEKLKIRNSLPPRIYGLPKVHKADIPLRPIVSCIQSPFYNLSKFLADILKNITGNNDHNVKSTWDFVRTIYNHPITEEYTIMSLDVESMYTSIPTELALEVVAKQWEKIKNHTSLPKEYFMEATTTCLTSTYFRYGKDYYEQTSGLPMGGPLSSTVANLVLEELEESCLKQCHFPVSLYKRYVDDIITIIPKGQEKDMQDIFNSFNEKIKFTIEKEKGGVIDFLDVKLIRREDHITTQWHIKPTSSGRYLNFKSSAPKRYKENVVKNLTTRAITFTNPRDRPQHLQNVKTLLKDNGYPDNFVNNIIKKQINKFYNPGTKDKEKSNGFLKNEDTIISFPYVKGLTETISKSLKKYNIKVVSSTGNSLKGLYNNLKTPIEKEKNTHVVYKVNCNDCEGTYIGQTKQYLENRMKEHISSIKGKNNNKTALKKHVIDKGHTFNFEEVEILNKEVKLKKRLFLEMIRIKQNNNSVNDRTDVEGLSNCYNNIIGIKPQNKNDNIQKRNHGGQTAMITNTSNSS